MIKYPEKETVWVSRVINGFREVPIVVGPKSLWTNSGSGFGVDPSRCKVLEKFPSDLSDTGMIKLLVSQGVDQHRIRFKRRCKNLEKLFIGDHLNGFTSI